MIKKKRIRVKDAKLKELLKKNERQEIKKDFFELLKRAIGEVNPKSKITNHK